MSSPSGIDFGTKPRVRRIKKYIIAVGGGLLAVVAFIIVGGIRGHVDASSKEATQTYTPATATAKELLASHANPAAPPSTVSYGAARPSAPPVIAPPPPLTYMSSPPPPPAFNPQQFTSPQVQEPTPEQKAAVAAAISEQQAMAAPASPQGWKLPGSQGESAKDPQDEKEAFLERKAPKPDLSAVRVPPKSPYVILRGGLIPATLEFRMNSDLPGDVKAKVRGNVFDTATGRYLLIPQNSTLVGVYSSHVSYGQNAAQQAWSRINFPDGSTVDLGEMPGIGAQGDAGLRDQVDNHYRRIFSTAFLTSGFFVLGALSQSRRGSTLAYPSASETASSSMAQQMSEQGIEITRQNTRIPPTIKIRPGDTFDVFVNRDMVFKSPYSKMTPRE